MQILCCRRRTLWTMPRMGVCEPLMPDVVAPKAHQNNHSYVSSADLPSDSLCKNLAWWVVTRRTSKNHKTVQIGGWVLARDITVMSFRNGKREKGGRKGQGEWCKVNIFVQIKLRIVNSNASKRNRKSIHHTPFSSLGLLIPRSLHVDYY